MIQCALDENTCRDDMLRTLGEHSAVIIHELRGPLAAIRANLQTMERLMSNRGDVSQQERFQTLYTEISHMGDLLDQDVYKRQQRHVPFLVKFFLGKG